ncbi:MAG: hypothetical protein GOP50_11480 [Candidatus Heimdallarchaeota archaeon]|nr:hypothetical protein [Candidatus Heimdallarchaeota archaeon]
MFIYEGVFIVSLEGSWWRNWNGSATYLIDGFANNNDPYLPGTPMIPKFAKMTILLMLSITSLTIIFSINVNKRKLRK